jgi:hypothetical protein
MKLRWYHHAVGWPAVAIGAASGVASLPSVQRYCEPQERLFSSELGQLTYKDEPSYTSCLEMFRLASPTEPKLLRTDKGAPMKENGKVLIFK